MWRKAYLILQSGLHLTPEGEAKITLKKMKLAQLRKANLEALSKEEIESHLDEKQNRKILRETKKQLKLND